LKFQVLGPLVVEGDAGPIEVAGTRRKALLLRLLVSANYPVSDDRLAEDLWGDGPPSGVSSTLASHISLLRQLIGRGRITRRAGGYVLRVDDGELDATSFESRVDRGHRALKAGSAEAARRYFLEALGQWHGPALMDVEGAPWAQNERGRLEELRLTCQESLIEARLRLGHHRQVVAATEVAVAEHPLRERRWGQLMIALYRSNRQADALQAYQRLRTYLDEELGIGPSEELELLDKSIIAHDPGLEWQEDQSVIDLNIDDPKGDVWRSDARESSRFAGPMSLPLPERLALPPSIGVIGREREIGLIAKSITRVGEKDQREVLLISGEAGIGKTTLVAEAARTALDQGACVLFGHCEEDLATPYQLFAEALDFCIAEAPEDRLLVHLEEYAPELARLVPSLRRRFAWVPPSKATDSDAERYLLFAAVVGFLTELSRQQLVVLVLDDLQWADEGSLHMLRHLVAADHTNRLLLMGTYRDTERSTSGALMETLAALRRHREIHRIELGGLDESGVKTFMQATTGHALDDSALGLAWAVYCETDGNPFFVSELLRHLVDTGAINQGAGGTWVNVESLERTDLPDSVREVIGSRLLRLGADAQRVLSLAAAIGVEFDLELLRAASMVAENELLGILEAASAAALVREQLDASGRYNFVHAIIQRTLYEGLGPSRRAQAHRRIAEALEELCGDHPGIRVGELARQWSLANQPVDLARAINYSKLAGDAALEALAPIDANRYFEQAVGLFSQWQDPDPVLKIDLAIGLGIAQRQIGDPAFRRTLLDASNWAAERGDTERLVAAALSNDRGWVSTVGAMDGDKIRMLELLLEQLPADSTDRGLVLAALCSELAYGSSLERRQALSDEAMAIASAHGIAAITVRVLNHVFIPLLVPSLQNQSLARTAEALALAEEIGDPVLLNSAAVNRAVIAGRVGDIDELDRCIEIVTTMAERLGQANLNWEQLFIRTGRALIEGDTDRAELLSGQALTLGIDSGQPDAELIYGAQLMIVMLQRGRLGELIPLMDQWTAVTPDIDLGVVNGLRAHAHAEGDRVAEARECLAEFERSGFDLPVDGAWFTGMAGYAEAAIECGDPTFARPLFDRLEPWADQMSYTGSTVDGPVSHFLGGLSAVLGEYDDANSYFARSIAFSEGIGAKYFAARTEWRWGNMLVDRGSSGDVDRARALLTHAHEVAAAYGYGKIEERAGQCLSKLA
jgi:DNA-binding SARP family transcriptional activator